MKEMMNKKNEKQAVQKQYATSQHLETRIMLHDKYSINKQGYYHWIVEQYKITPGMHILELGCGTGSMWKRTGVTLPSDTSLVLTDYSEGMLQKAKDNIGETLNCSFAQADIQALPFETESFDVVIANMMLYHVPDLEKGLAEVQRVLKKGGIFYCTTYGENGIVEYVLDLLSEKTIKEEMSLVFTLQNGEEKLEKHFNKIEIRRYEDALEVTDIEDLLNYLKSLISVGPWSIENEDRLRRELEKTRVQGSIHLPKEQGMFIASKE